MCGAEQRSKVSSEIQVMREALSLSPREYRSAPSHGKYQLSPFSTHGSCTVDTGDCLWGLGTDRSLVSS